MKVQSGKNQGSKRGSKAAPVLAKASTKSGAKLAVKTKAKPVARSEPKRKPAGKPAAPARAAVPAKTKARKALTKVAVGPAKAVKVNKTVKVAKPARAVKTVKAAVPVKKPVKAVQSSGTKKTKDSVNTTIAKARKPVVVAPKSKVKATGAVRSAPAATAPTPAGTHSIPQRSGRASSRLAQLTVPSMAQSVASTAAKASFAPALSSPLIIPPLASSIKKDSRLANNWKSKPVEQLSDAEVIAMPEAEYMNETQIAFFRHRLHRLKNEILSNAGETTEHLREDTVVVPDPADRATIEEEHALELRTRDRERKLLKKIEQSIARLDSGDYGYCDETGEPIGVGRLLARPTANLSLEAQQRRELKQKMFGD